mmetsp:Transcript_42043/g.121940  ORF Transcript_42043/g.121940 Transcript_42043/m.121940 type:complete len:208 (-) Transcript_42043:201-824(-)
MQAQGSFKKACSSPNSTTESEAAAHRPLLRRPVSEQTIIVRELDLWLRYVGVVTGFLTVVFVWEAHDMVVHKLYHEHRHQFCAYCAGVFIWAGGLVLCHLATRRMEGSFSLHASLCYAYCTLFLSICSWGVIQSLLETFVPEKWRLMVWAAGAVFFTALHALYMHFTHHNALLDIASCALSLGLIDPDNVAVDEFLPTYKWTRYESM